MAKELAKAVDDYLAWMIAVGYASGTIESYENALNHFQNFINRQKIRCDDVFTYDTLNAFEKDSDLYHASTALRGLSRYLFKQKLIPDPMRKPIVHLTEIYEDYLHYYEKTRQVHRSSLIQTRSVLSALNDYLSKQDIDLAAVKIEQIDSFLSEFNACFMPATCHHNRSYLRGFLRYLYFYRKILKRDLAPLIVGAPMFAQAQPPKFLRSDEVKALFAGLSTDSCKELRTSAMVHLGYTLGLRPKEIGLIRLNDISFAQREISLADRKSANPIKLPLPEITIKAIAAYIVGCRPESDYRALFLTFHPPVKPVAAATVSCDITVAMRKINPLSSAYWLRHTYAQNLLESGASIFEVKQMMGHDNVQSTKRYLHIHTKLMHKELCLMRHFKSSLAILLKEYIGYRCNLGYSDKNLRFQLRTFDRHVFNQGAELSNLTALFFLELKKKFKEKQRTFNAILLAMRGFFNYLVRRQIIDKNPLIDICSYRPNAFIPFIFSPDQIDKLLVIIQKAIRKDPMCFFKDYSVYMAILLLARCGMRISEPLRLKPGHYSSNEGTIYIEKTKFSKDRLIPAPKTVISEMGNYLAVRKAFVQAQTSYLLPGQNGHTLSSKRIYKAFGQAVKDIGIDQPRRIIANTTFGNPRPHSLRHSFAINTLKRIKQQGKSPQNALPILAVYLGHRKYRYTAVYLKVVDAEHRQGLVDFAISRQEEI